MPPSGSRLGELMMSGELVDTQLARRRLPWGLGKQRVGVDADTVAPGVADAGRRDLVGRRAGEIVSGCCSMTEGSCQLTRSKSCPGLSTRRCLASRRGRGDVVRRGRGIKKGGKVGKEGLARTRKERRQQKVWLNEPKGCFPITFFSVQVYLAVGVSACLLLNQMLPYIGGEVGKEHGSAQVRVGVPVVSVVGDSESGQAGRVLQ